jgi:hypothetical protein
MKLKSLSGVAVLALADYTLSGPAVHSTLVYAYAVPFTIQPPIQ